MIRVEPGPWHVDSSQKGWGIINVKTGQTIFIGKSGGGRQVNNFDKAKHEASRRNNRARRA